MRGLGIMAWRLACQRRYFNPDALPIEWLAPRWIVNAITDHTGAQGEYFKIVDRITRGEKP